MNKEDLDNKIDKLAIDIASLTQQLKRKRNEWQYYIAERNNSLFENKQRPFSLPDALELALREAEKPMTSGQLKKAVEAYGFFVDKQAVSSTLVRYNQKNQRFKRKSPGYYDLAERVD